MLFGRDKLWHFLASWVMVWFFFGLLTLLCHLKSSWDDVETDAANDADAVVKESRQNNDDDDCNNTIYNNAAASSTNAAKPQASSCSLMLLQFFENLVVQSYLRMCLASFLSFLVGAAKEIADLLWNGWPWCSNGVCDDDGWDILANIVGIAMGSLFLLASMLVAKIFRGQRESS